ncbi:MAG: hypothetical protein DRP29_03080 [Thermodesulfobacteriota bacterium]|nr:MAG: hypothetical protein DRP29_03080 [Thermodesulfobacteriota bacterium]
MTSYRIVRCPNSTCHRVQVTTAEKWFRCKFCGVNRKFESVEVLKVTNDGLIARNFCAKYVSLNKKVGFGIYKKGNPYSKD